MAIDEGPKQEANEIKVINRGENQKRKWRGLDQGLGKTCIPAPTMVEMADESGKVSHITPNQGENRRGQPEVVRHKV